MMIVDEVRPIVGKKIAQEAEALNELSQDIWNHPELNFQENYAHDVLTRFLESRGFKIHRAFHLPTAFKAEFVAPGGADGVTICIMCEYDALPDIGHGCGHNLIAEAGVGAALGVKAAMEASKKIKGKLVVMGTPAEEGGGGKIILIKAGALKGIDFAMMSHPSTLDAINGKALAIEHLTVQFFGKEAHASASPWEGINALDAVIASYINIAQFRQQMHPTWRIHGVITQGGVKPNIIPAKTEMEFYIRAPSWPEVATLKKAAIGCFEAAAKCTGCTSKYIFKENSNYDSFLLNHPMLEAYRIHGEREGVEFAERQSSGSTDMGNVTHVIPSIHTYFKIPCNGVTHTKTFAAAAASPEAQPPTLRTSRLLALTAIQLYTDKKLQEESRMTFENANK